MKTFKTNGTNRTFKKSMGKRTLSLFLAVILGVGGAISGMGDLLIKGKSGVQEVYADDLTFTVPGDEGYRFEVHTYNDGRSGDVQDGIVPNSPYNVGNVVQSTSSTSATTFASGLPLSTIYIDQSKIVGDANAKSAKFYVFAGPYASAISKNPNSGLITYDATKEGTKKISGGVINELEGNLFYVEFPDAAILPDGSTANLRITYSDAKIVIDQRYAAGSRDGNSWPAKDYNGQIHLATGSKISYGGTDATDISVESTSTGITYPNSRAAVVQDTAQQYDTGQTFGKTTKKQPMVGMSIDVTYQIVDATGYPVQGTFIFAICGINLDRDPYKGVNAGNNICKPLWYVNDLTDTFNDGGTDYTVYSDNGKKYINKGTSTNPSYYELVTTVTVASTASTLSYNPSITSEVYNDGTNDYTVYLLDGKKYINKGTETVPAFYELITVTTVASTPAAVQPNNTLTYGEEFHFFSEAMSVNSGMVSDYIYVRSIDNDLGDDNNNVPVNNQKIGNSYYDVTQHNQTFFYPQVTTDANGNTKFIGNGSGNNPTAAHLYNDSQASDNTYSSGFVTLADAARGFKVTATGHGGSGHFMNSTTFTSETIWYRYTSGSGPHGKIELTSEGNNGGRLNDGGNVLPGGDNPNAEGATGNEKPNTYIVTEGKTVTYTMTPEVGYKLKKVTINGADIKFNGEDVSKMKKGDSITVNTADYAYWDNPDTEEPRDPSKGQGILTYEGDGIYTFTFNHAKEHEKIFVEWEPTTADILAYKIWDDDDDRDGIREDADKSSSLPKFKLEWSKNGRDWNEVTTQMDIGLKKNDGTVQYYTLPTPVTQETVPNGKDSSGNYLDGTYVINRGTVAVPDKWIYAGTEYDSEQGAINARSSVAAATITSTTVGEGDAAVTTYTYNGKTYEAEAAAVAAFNARNPITYVRGCDEHPFTWEYLPVYTYDRNGRADKAIQYRIVEINDPWQYEYEKAKYYEHQIFDLTSSEDNSIEGWGIYTDGTNSYIKRGDKEYEDGLFYRVDPTTGVAEASPANPQPIGLPDAPNVSSSGYWTEDHAIPYHEIEAKNEHYTSEIYVDVVKYWNDKVMTEDASATSKTDYTAELDGYKHKESGEAITVAEYEALDSPEEKNNYDPVYKYVNTNNPTDVVDKASYDALPDENKYARKDINIVLHGEIEKGDGTMQVVDLDPNSTSNDLIKTIALNESDNKDEVTGYEEIDGYTKYVDENNVEYVYVTDKENVQDGYYKVVNGAVDYEGARYVFNKGEVTPVKKNGDGTYKVNGDRYGAMFEWLPTHYEGKHIIYTVTETDTSGKPLSEWILTGGQLAEVKEGSKLLGYETTMTNTPDVDIEYTPVPLTIRKVDKTTGNPLEGAEFTVYLDPTPGVETKASESEDLIVGKKIYTLNKNYVKQKDTSDNKDKYYEVNGETISSTPAYPQPEAGDLTDTGKKVSNKTVYNLTKDYIIQKDSSDDVYKYYEVVSGAAEANPADPQPSVAYLVENGKLNGEEGYTDGTNTYVLRSGQYHLVDNEGNVADSPASPQPDPNVTRKAKNLKSGVAEENTVVTDSQGYATVTFLLPNDDSQAFYYIKETNAPEGYSPDPDPYAFKIDANLKTLTLEEYPNHEHTTPWWEKLYDLLFGDEITYDNWVPDADKRGGTLTVEDTPIVADILVRKYWNDNNDQDGKRPGDKNNQTSTEDPNLPKVTLQYTLGAHTAEGQNIYTDGIRYYVYKPEDGQYYEVDGTTTQGSYGSYATPDTSLLTETGETCRNYPVYTDGTNKYAKTSATRYRKVTRVDVRNPYVDTTGTYQYSAANPQPASTTDTTETCAGLPVYKDENDNKYVIIDHVYHAVDNVDVAGKLKTTPAAKQPDPNSLELLMTGDWIDADVPAEYKEPHVSYVGGPVLTHQNDAYTWTNLPAYMDGKVVTYRILETGDILDNTKTIYAYDIESSHTSQTHEKTFSLVNNSGAEPTGLNQTVDVTNKHETQVVNIEVYKEWEDDDPDDRSTAKLYLYKVLDGIEYPVTSVDEHGNIYEDIGTVPVQVQDGKWIYKWEDLPTYEGGQPITYRVREEKVDGYLTIYKAKYTNTSGTNIDEETTDIVAEDIKRTFYAQGDSIPEGKKVGSENTTASFKILNERSVNIKVDKTWVNGANASVTYELWRTIVPEDQRSASNYTKTAVSADDPNVYYVHKTIIKTIAEYEAITDEDERAKYELKYVNDENPNDILTIKQWTKLDNPDQLRYERKYVNNSDSTDIITIADYGALTPKGKNSYTEQDYYVNNSDSSITQTEADYETLEPEEQAEYSKAYKDNDTEAIINALTYDTLSAKGQNDYDIKYVDKTNPSDIITEEAWAALPNTAQQQYSEKYVDDKHVIISKDAYQGLSPEEKALYDIEHTTSWSPYGNGSKDATTYVLKSDGTTITKAQYDALDAVQKRQYEPNPDEIVDGWELVDSHVFDANDFINPSNTGDVGTWTFNDLLIKDANNNKYMYRILEKPALNRFRENQISEYKIINNNVNVSDGNVTLEVVKEVENRNWLDTDEFFFYLEPVKGVDVTDPNAPVDIAKDQVPMPYRTDPATTATTYNYTADAVDDDPQVGAIGRAATFQAIQYKENSALYHSIARGDIVEFYYRVYEVYDPKNETSGSDTIVTANTSLDEATDHSGYKDGITYAGQTINLTEDQHDALGAIGKDSYMQTSAYIDESTDPVSIISVTAYNALPEGDRANYKATTGYVNINDATDLITKNAYDALPEVGKDAFTKQTGYVNEAGDKAINQREYDKLTEERKEDYSEAQIWSAFVPKVHEAKVIAKNVDGIITTETQWLKDGEYKTGAVPVYTNSYSSEGYAKAWIEKKIADREWVDYTVDSETGKASGDAFEFNVDAIAGANLNTEGHVGDSYTTMPLMSNEDNNPQWDVQQMSDTEYAFGIRGNKYDNTMLNADGYAYFIYEIYENPSVTYKDDTLGYDIKNYTVDGLDYDTVGEEPRKIYAKVKATDNWDGTISFTIEYYSDASCKARYKIDDYKAWIYDDDSETERGKYLLTMTQAEAAEGMTEEEREQAHYRKIDVAYFVNHQTGDIPVIKQWVGGPAIEDVNLHLEQHLFPITGNGAIDEASITDAYVKEQEEAVGEKNFWQTAGYTHLAERGEFLDGEGEPKYDEGSTDTSSKRYEDILGFNKDLPQYVVKNGVTYRIVYRLYEDDTSNTYERSYKSINVITEEKYGELSDESKAGYEAKYENKNNKTLITPEKYAELGEEEQANYIKKYAKETDGDYIYTDGDTLVVINTVTATNVAKPAAVKQLLNRNWLDSDDFKFTLTPIGKYNKAGEFVATEDIPMPTTDEYVNKNDSSDVISKTDYEDLTELGKNDYSEDPVEAYVNTNDPSDIISEAAYYALDPQSLQEDYTDTTAYVNINDADDLISETAYAALDEKGKSSYKPKEINDEAHVTKNEKEVDEEGHLERLARFGEIEFTTKDLIYNETDKHYHGDFFYEMAEEIPAGAYAVNKTTLEKVLNGEDPIVFDPDFTKTEREQYYWKDDASGIIYDGSVHTVHIHVKENRTSELQVQVAYDESAPGKISTGTQFTPVYTNRYDATLIFSQEIDKYIMGRYWKEGDEFDFRMTAMSGAPFEDADEDEFHKDDTSREDTTYTDTLRNEYLETGKAVHSSRGAHVKRLKIDSENVGEEIQSMYMPKIKIELDDLHNTVGAGDTLKYSDGEVVPEGMAYGQFIYSFEEITDYLGDAVKDLSVDGDTEYARITVIDTGNGTLDYYTEVFEDRYCTVPRYIPNTTTPAENPTFVNQLKRELSITKKWVEPATSDITLRLEWSVDDEHWYYVDDAEWMPAGIRNTQTIKKGAFGDALTVTWHNLPAYANITSVGDQEGDDKALNDIWVYYRIVEDDIQDVTTRYSTEPYAPNDTPDDSKYKTKEDQDSPHTGPERESNLTYTAVTPEDEDNPAENGWFEYDGENYNATSDTTVGEKTYYKAVKKYVAEADRVKQLYVTNWPKDIEGEAKVGLVKQYIGKTWSNEEFTFEIEAIESQIGGETAPVKDGEIREVTNYKNTETEVIISEAEYKTISSDTERAKYEPIEVEQLNVMPKYNKENGNEAVANITTSTVSVNEHAANFDPLTIKLSDLAVDYREKIDDPENPGTQIENPNYGKAVGIFYYKVYEQIPDGSVKTNEVCGKNAKNEDVKYVVGVDKNLNKIKYTTEEHIVKIVAVDDGSGKIDITTSFDDREHGEYVPVYTNYAMMETPVEGEKQWVGGEKKDHVNGTVKLNTEKTEIDSSEPPTDKLGLKLTRSLDGENFADVQADDAGRPLAIVWVKESRGEKDVTEYVLTDDNTVKSGKTYYSDSEGQNPVTELGGKIPREEGWYEAQIKKVNTFSYEEQVGEASTATGKGSSGPYTYTIKAVVTEQVDDGHGGTSTKTTYVDPFLNLVDKAGNEYTYKISEGNVPTGYKESIDGLDVTNAYNVKDTIKVTKTWDDGSDAEGLRPEKVVMHLYKLKNNGTETVQVEVAKKEISKANTDTLNEWTSGATWTDLDIYDENGDPITYIVIEESEYGYTTTYKVLNDPTVTGYSETGNSLVLDGITSGDPQTIDVKNTLVPAVAEVRVTKVWDDNDNVDNKRPAAGVQFTLYERVWDDTLNDGKGGYGAEKEATKADGTTKIAKLTLDETADAATNEVREIEKTDGNTWVGLFTNLPGTKNEKTVIYYVKETTDLTTTAIGYEAPVVTGNQLDGFTVTNKRQQDTVDAKVTKVWADNNNYLNTRPDTIEIELYRKYLDGTDQLVHQKVDKDVDGNDIKALLSADDALSTDTTGNTWYKAVDNLPKNLLVDVTSGAVTTKVTREYTYYWKEKVPTGYTAAASSNTVGETATETVQDVDNEGTLINTFVTGKITLTKTWNDGNDVDDLRPTENQFGEMLDLFANNIRVEDFGSDPKVTKNVTKGTGANANKYTVTYKNLPVFDKNGTLITYKVEEDAIAGYTISATPAADLEKTLTKSGNDYSAEMSLTNKHEPGTTSITVTKIWEDEDNKDGKRPSVDELKAAIKLYKDGNSEAGATYDTDTYKTVHDNGDGTYTVTWSNLPANKNNGDPIIYSAKEDGAAGNEAFAYYDSYVAANGPDYDNTNASGAGIEASHKADETQAYNGGKITNKQVLTDITVRYVWNDKINDVETHEDIVNADRPEKITLVLKDPSVAASAITREITPDDEDTNDYTFTKVPIYKANGTDKYNYDFTEEPVSGYKVTYITVGNIKVAVNTYEVTKLEGTKEWVDGGMKHDNPTDVALTVHYQKVDSTGADVEGGEGTVNSPKIVWSTATPGKFTVIGLPSMDNEGNTYKYWVTETAITGYTTTYDNTNATDNANKTETEALYNGGKVVNTLKKDNLKVTKIWDDGDNAEGIRPDNVTVHLYKMDETSMVSAGKEEKVIAGAGTATWEDLPVYDASGNPIEYIVIEESVAGYTSKYCTTENGTYVNEAANAVRVQLNGTTTDQTIYVKNSLTPATSEIKVTKVWDDDDNADGKRPAEVKVDLYEYVWDKTANSNKGGYVKNDTKVRTYTLKAADNWTVTDDTLPLTKKSKTVIYTVDETQLDNYEEPVITGNQLDGFTVTNTRAKDTIKVTVNKVWANDVEEYRPDHIKVYLLADGEAAVDVYGNTVSEMVLTDDTWSGEFKNLPKNKVEGGVASEIVYNVEEEVIPGYEVTYADPVKTADTTTLKITNTAKPGTLVITKTWDDNDDDANIRPSATEFADALEVMADGKKVDLTLDGTPSTSGNVTTVKYKDVPVYDSGEKITYTVEEDFIPGYELTVAPLPIELKEKTVSGKKVFTGEITLTNKHESEISITGTKVWVDGDKEHDNKTEVKLVLHRQADGQNEEILRDVTPKWGEDEDNKNEYTFTGLESENDKGKIYTYWVTEERVDGYDDPEYDNSKTPNEAHKEKTDVAYDKGEITNKLSQEFINVRVTKKWDDNNDQDGLRGPVVVKLIADGVDVLDIAGKNVTVELNEENNYVGIFDNLPYLTEEGKAIKYTVAEISAPDGYTASEPVGSADSGFIVINSHEPEVITVTASKVWDDDVDTYRSDVTLHLYGLDRDGKIVYDAGAKTIAKGSNEDAVWTGVPKRHYDNKDLKWKVVEDSVFGYITSISGPNAENHFEVTNTYVGPTTEVKVSKTWEDNDNVDKTRSGYVTYELWSKVGNGDAKKVDEQKVKVAADGSATYVWTDLPVVQEETTTVSGTRVEMVEKEVQATNDEGELLFDGDEPIMTTIMVEEEVEYTENVNVPVDILYTVKEQQVTGYKAPVVVATAPGEFEVINQRDRNTVSLTVKKAWADSEDKDGIRPDHVAIKIKADGEEVLTAVLTEESGWKGTFDNMPKNAEGEVGRAIVYTVEESGVEGYEATYGGKGTELVITNTHNPEASLTLEVTKVWANEKGDTSARKDVVLHLMKVVEGYGPVEIKEQTKTIPAKAEGDDLTVKWTGLSAMEGGKKVTYTVEEDPIEGYETEMTDGKLNEAGDTISITVTNSKEKGPDKITVSYIDEATGETYIKEIIDKGDAEPEQPADPEKEGYTFGGWDRTTDKDCNVVYKARWIEDPKPEEITISYKDGDKTIRTDTIEKGDKEPAQPADPEKEGFTFGGWDRTTDDDGNVVYEAKWIKNPEPDEITVTYMDGDGVIKTETIKKGDKESGQPADPEKKDGYTFGGWDRETDDDGNVIYRARWIEDPKPGEITVTYKDGDNTIDSNTITRGTDEPGQPGVGAKEGFTFGGWIREVDADGNVTYTANWVEEVERTFPKVTYVDPRAEDGEMILGAKKYGDQAAADREANELKSDAPENPTHDGYTFTGWAVNQDEFGDYILVAKYNEKTPEPPKNVISFIDPQASGDEMVLKTIVIDDDTDLDSIEPPADPAHENMRFLGWEKTQDANGNWIYAAKYQSDCVNPQPPKNWVMYIDEDGSIIYMDKTEFENGEEPEPPADPTKDGYTFEGWIRNQDEDGNVTYVAKWRANEVPPKEYWVRYIDADGIEFLTKTTVKPGDKEPKAPIVPKKDGYNFSGWNRTVDEDGNVTYIAKWTKLPDPVDPKPEPKPVDPEPAKPVPEKPASVAPKTGDESNMEFWLYLNLLALMSAALTALVNKRRSISKNH